MGNVRGRESWSGIDRCNSCRSRGAHRARSAGLPEWIIFIVGKEEEFVLEDRTSNLTADAVEVVPRLRGEPFQQLDCVERIVVAIVVIDVSQAMVRIRPALHNRVELPA